MFGLRARPIIQIGQQNADVAVSGVVLRLDQTEQSRVSAGGGQRQMKGAVQRAPASDIRFRVNLIQHRGRMVQLLVG